MKSQKSNRRMANKTALILEHLQKNKTITSWEAIEKYEVTRLSAVIYNLRKKYCINSVNRAFTDKYGNTTTFNEYIYCGELITTTNN